MTLPATLVFEETQWFYRRWWWLMLTLTALMVGILIPALGQPQGLKVVLVTVTFVLPVLVGLWLMRLTVRVDAAGIHYQYVPFLNRWRHWPWSEFRRVFSRSFAPLGDFGGWGIRGLPGDLAYNVWGDAGWQLVFQSGNKLLLGTHRPAELRKVLAALHAADASWPIEA